MPETDDRVTRYEQFLVLATDATVGAAYRSLPEAADNPHLTYLVLPLMTGGYLVVCWVELEEIARRCGYNIAGERIGQLAHLFVRPGYVPASEPMLPAFAEVTFADLLRRLTPVRGVDEQQAASPEAGAAREAHPGRRLVVTAGGTVAYLLIDEPFSGSAPATSPIATMIAPPPIGSRPLPRPPALGVKTPLLSAAMSDGRAPAMQSSPPVSLRDLPARMSNGSSWFPGEAFGRQLRHETQAAPPQAAPDAPPTPDGRDPVLVPPHVVPFLFQQRRLDAAVPAVAGVGQQIRLLAQLRFATSPDLGAEAWPANAQPDQVVQASEALRLRFPRDTAGRVQYVPLLVKVATLGFHVPEPEKLIEVPADDLSPVVSFVMEAREPGQIPIDVSVYSLEARPRRLGTARITTRIGPAAVSDPPLATTSLAVSVETGFASLEIEIDVDNGQHEISLVFTPPNGRSESTLAAEIPLDLSPDAVQAAVDNSADPVAYGRALSQLLFADQRLRNAWRDARRFAEGAGTGLRVRVSLEAGSSLHWLRWETLRDPLDDTPLALSEHTPISRRAVSPAMASLNLVAPADLAALAVVASPDNLAEYALTPIDVDAEIDQAQQAFAGIPLTVLARHPTAAGAAQLHAIGAALRAGAHVLYLVCHGQVIDGVHYLCLEDAQGQAEWVPAAEFVQAVSRRDTRPQLTVLCTCHGAGGGYDGTLSAVGPQLAVAGLPAVIAFQGYVAMTTTARLIPPLLGELVRDDGVVDRSLAAARGALGSDEWWQVVLWLATHDGRLWAGHEAAAGAVPVAPARLDPSEAVRKAIATWRKRIAELATRSATDTSPALAAELAAATRMVETLEAALRTVTPSGSAKNAIAEKGRTLA